MNLFGWHTRKETIWIKNVILDKQYGVGPVFARIIFDVGIKSVKSFINYKAEEFINIYENKTKKKADFGVNDINFSIELAKELEI